MFSMCAAMIQQFLDLQFRREICQMIAVELNNIKRTARANVFTRIYKAPRVAHPLEETQTIVGF